LHQMNAFIILEIINFDFPQKMFLQQTTCTKCPKIYLLQILEVFKIANVSIIFKSKHPDPGKYTNSY
jgi:hypothetical protein